MSEKQATQSPDHQFHPPYYQPYDGDEIALIDLLRVIWKWKWLIIAGTLICVVAAVVYAYQLPKIYQVDMIIEPGIISINDTGGVVYLDSPENISRKINQQAYNQRIIKALNIDPEEVWFEIAADKNGKTKSQIIQVTSGWEEKKVTLGRDVLNHLITLLTDDYRAVVEQKKLNYDSKIANNKNKIQDIEVQRKDLEKQIQVKLSDVQAMKQDIQLKQERLGNVKKEIDRLLLEIKQVKKNSEKITERRQRLINGGDSQDEMSLMLYGTTLQQNILYFNELNSQIYNLTQEQNVIESQISARERDINEILGAIDRLRLKKDEGVQIQIDDINAEIERLQSEKQIITNINVIKTPEVSAKPIKPRKKQIMALTGVAALFMFIFLSFFIEYIRNASKKEP